MRRQKKKFKRKKVLEKKNYPQKRNRFSKIELKRETDRNKLLTRPVLDRFHDSSKVMLNALYSRLYAYALGFMLYALGFMLYTLSSML
jgi:hypothetical protein